MFVPCQLIAVLLALGLGWLKRCYLIACSCAPPHHCLGGLQPSPVISSTVGCHTAALDELGLIYHEKRIIGGAQDEGVAITQYVLAPIFSSSG